MENVFNSMMEFKTTEFEEAWKQYNKLPNAHFISSNTVGLHLALNLFIESMQHSIVDATSLPITTTSIFLTKS